MLRDNFLLFVFFFFFLSGPLLSRYQTSTEPFKTSVPIYERIYGGRFASEVDIRVKKRKEFYRPYKSYIYKYAEIYFPIFDIYIEKYDLPKEIKVMAIVESSFDAQATSRVGAKGLWQLMPEIADKYGLYRDDLVDQSYDPFKSTDAAFQYLKWLHKYLNKDWFLTIAAYNAGIGKVSSLLKKHNAYDVWSIYKYLPRETQYYLASVFALTDIVINTNEKFDSTLLTETDFVYLKQQMTVDEFISKHGLSAKHLRLMNTAYTTHMLPAGDKNRTKYGVRIPTRVIKRVGHSLFTP